MLKRQRGSGNPAVFSTAFWLTIGLAMYLVLLLPDPWLWLLVAAAGLGSSYGWWRRYRRGKYWFLSGAACALLALLALVGGGRAVFADVSVPADSVGQREILCGSLTDPVPGDQLQVTDVGSGEVVMQSRPLLRSEMERVCVNRLRYRVGDAIGLTLVGLLLAIRALGHVFPHRRPMTTDAIRSDLSSRNG